MTSEFRDDGPAIAARDDERKAEAAGRDNEDSVIGRTVTINRPRDEIYAFCRDLPKLQPIMENVERIEMLDARRSRWTMTAPGGREAQWESVITEDEPGRLIAWQSVEDSAVSSSGRMEFLDAAPGRGTMVRGAFAYDAPAGSIGAWIAGLFSGPPQLSVNKNLRRLKQYLETGEITNSAGPSGRDEDPTEQHP